MSKKAACYCRVSTDKEEQLQSLEMQKQSFREYCDKNNLELYNIYPDEGISGKSFKKRKAFNRMMADAQKGLFDIILVKDFSRFSRNTVDLLSNIRKLKAMNIPVIFLNYNMDNMGESELLITVMGAMAQEELHALSKKVKSSKRINASRGRVPNFAFGYDHVDTFNLEVNEQEAYWVRKIFEMYVYEGMGTMKIAEHLNSNNVSTKKKGTNGWSQHVIASILKNQLYIGKVVNRKSEVVDVLEGTRKKFGKKDWIIVERPDFRIIDDELFQKAENLIESRRESFKSNRKRPSNKYPLSNLLICENDGYSFRRCSRQYSHSGKRYTWWTCSYRNAKGASSCNNLIKVDENDMHSAIIEFLNSLCTNKGNIAKQVSTYVEKELKVRYENNYNKNELVTELKELNVQKDRLFEAYTKGVINLEDFSTRVNPITNRIELIKADLEVYRNYDEVGIDIEKSVENFIRKIEIKSDEVLSNQFLKDIFDKFMISEDGKITAVLKIDYDTGLSMDIPFGEIIENDNDISVPNHNSSTHCYDKMEWNIDYYFRLGKIS